MQIVSAVRTAAVSPEDSETVLIPLSAGLSLISVPLWTSSNQLSDIFTNLPPGSRVWTWNANDQNFVEGFDQPLSLGQGCVLYLPVPATIEVSGIQNDASSISVDLSDGWNLVGVPYTVPLPRSAQSVYAEFAPTPFEDAVAEGAIGDTVYSADVNGYRSVDPGNSLQPMQAYWIYSNGTNTIDLAPQLLRGDAGDFAFWLAKQVGGAAVSWGVGQLLSSITSQPDPSGEILKQIEALSDQIGDLQDDQAKIAVKVDQLATITKTKTEEIIQKIWQQRVSDVQDQLNAHFVSPVYDSTKPPSTINSPCFSGGKDCLEYFAATAKTSAGPQSIAVADNTEFAYNVLNTWNFQDQILKIYGAMTGTNGDGLLQSYATWVGLAPFQTGASRSVFKDRYAQFSAYFNRLIGMQRDCMTLVTNAMNQLSTVPPYKGQPQPSSTDAETWRKGSYDALIREEYRLFGLATEDAAMSRVQIPTTGDVWRRQPVVLAGEGQEVLAQMDFMLGMALENPFRQGLRARLIVSPDIGGSPLTFSVFRSFREGGPQPLQGLDRWRTVTGPQLYDSWGWQTNAGQFVQGQGRTMRFTTDWKMSSIFVPVTSDQSFFLQWGNRGFKQLTGSVALKTYDNTYRQTTDPSGVKFGSMTLIARPSANEMLNPNFGAPSPQPPYGCSNAGYDILRTTSLDRPFIGTEFRTACKPTITGAPLTPPCDGTKVQACDSYPFVAILDMPFRYTGTSVKSVYQAAVDFKASPPVCSDPNGNKSNGYVYLMRTTGLSQFSLQAGIVAGVGTSDGITYRNGPTRTPNQGTSDAFTLEPGNSYSLELWNSSNPNVGRVARPTGGPCTTTMTLKGFAFLPQQ